jgi:Ca2+-binding EF-hand superfamily protein
MKVTILKFGLVALTMCAFSFSQAQNRTKSKTEKMFKSIDKNNDKYISLEEYTSKKRKNDVPYDTLEKMFQKMDTNKDGLLNLDEFTTSKNQHSNNKDKLFLQTQKTK